MKQNYEILLAQASLGGRGWAKRFIFILLLRFPTCRFAGKMVCLRSKKIFPLFTMEYKKVYTRAELDELIAWFTERAERLPASCDLLPGVHVADMQQFLLAERAMIELHHDNPTYGGTFWLLFRLRDKLQAEGLE